MRAVIMYNICVVTQRAQTSTEMLSMDRKKFIIADLKEKGLAEIHSETQALHYGKSGISTHGAALKLVKRKFYSTFFGECGRRSKESELLDP